MLSFRSVRQVVDDRRVLVGDHRLDAEHTPADVAVADHAGPPGVGRGHAAERRIGGEVDRKGEPVRCERVVQRRESHAGRDDRGPVRWFDHQTVGQPVGAQDDHLAFVAGSRCPDQPGVGPLGEQPCAVLPGPADDGTDGVDIAGVGQRPSARPPFPRAGRSQAVRRPVGTTTASTPMTSRSVVEGVGAGEGVCGSGTELACPADGATIERRSVGNGERRPARHPGRRGEPGPRPERRRGVESRQGGPGCGGPCRARRSHRRDGHRRQRGGPRRPP